MNFIFLDPDYDLPLWPIYAAIDNHSENIVGCILESGTEWFFSANNEDNTAQILFEFSQDKNRKAEIGTVYLIINNPNNVFELTVLFTNNCCNINLSGGGGFAGETLLKKLAEYNIRTYVPSSISSYREEYNEAFHKRDKKGIIEVLKKRFWESFGYVRSDWLSTLWNNNSHYIPK